MFKAVLCTTEMAVICLTSWADIMYLFLPSLLEATTSMEGAVLSGWNMNATRMGCIRPSSSSAFLVFRQHRRQQKAGIFQNRAVAVEAEMLTCVSDIPRMFKLTFLLHLNLVLLFGSKANQSWTLWLWYCWNSTAFSVLSLLCKWCKTHGTSN